MQPNRHLILASGSPVRRQVLTAAGVAFESQIPGIDERDIERRCRNVSHPNLANTLAAEKACAVSKRWPDAHVIGGDQLLVCDGVLHHKVDNLPALRNRLKRLSGRYHDLITAVAVAQDRTVLWQHVETVRLKMRHLSDAEIENYVEHYGTQVLDAVGGYHLEAAGIQLFDHMEGDYFAVLGLPLLPLLNFLRRIGALPGL